jgi:molecular chaperone GrpE (heat shock protein)
MYHEDYRLCKRRGNVGINKWLMLFLLIVIYMSRISFGQSLFSTSIVSPKNNEYVTNEKLIIKVKTDETDPQLHSKLYITAVLIYPGNALERISLSDDGLIDEDIPGDGIYVAKLEHLRVPGDYIIRAKVWNNGVEKWTQNVNFTFIPDGKTSKLNYLNENYLYVLLIILLAIILPVIFRKKKKIDTISEQIELQESTDSSDTNVYEVIKEIRRLRVEVGIIAETVQDNNSALSTQLSIIESEKIRSNENDELYNIRLELEASKSALDKWEETAIEYFETIERGIEGYGEDDPRGKALIRDASQFSHFCAAHGLERITAEPGDPLVDGLFQVVEKVQVDGIDSGTIASCVEWGYRSHTTVYKRAKVIIAE